MIKAWKKLLCMEDQSLKFATKNLNSVITCTEKIRLPTKIAYLLLINEDRHELTNFTSSSQFSHCISKTLAWNKIGTVRSELYEKYCTKRDRHAQNTVIYTCGLLCFPRISPFNKIRYESCVWSSSPDSSAKSSTPKQ